MLICENQPNQSISVETKQCEKFPKIIPRCCWAISKSNNFGIRGDTSQARSGGLQQTVARAVEVTPGTKSRWTDRFQSYISREIEIRKVHNPVYCIPQFHTSRQRTFQMRVQQSIYIIPPTLGHRSHCVWTLIHLNFEYMPPSLVAEVI